jgi:hypothetical protein
MAEHKITRTHRPHRSELHCTCGWAAWLPPTCTDEELSGYEAQHAAAAEEAQDG